MDIKDIQSLIKFVAKSGVSEVKLDMEDVKITIRTESRGSSGETTYIQQLPNSGPLAQPQQGIVPVVQEEDAVTAPQEAESEEDSNLITIKSPIIGTFYRKAAPDKELFVNVGDTIGEGDVLCVIEAMKLFNEIESEVSGKIVKVLVDDSSPVEFDQPLFLVDPS
jgi:acetyl-CoA carboxylase biotin carboxyl carrier protein